MRFNIRLPISSKSQAISLAVLAFALFLFIGTSISFLADSGTACSLCHATKQQVASWRNSPHKSISCLACHQDLGYLSFAKTELRAAKNFTAWIFRSYQDPITGRVKNENCLFCHDREVSGTIVSKGIRVSHKEFSTYNCTDCHASVAHEMKNRIRNQPDMDSCSACHNYAEGDVTCEKCHPQRSKTEELSSKGPWKLTHGPNWKATHGLGDPKTCSTCHDENFCMGCHKAEVPHTEPWLFLHSKAAKQNIQGCYQCHRKSLCDDCHRMEMPHPSGYIKEHEFIVAERGYDLCWRCHIKETCINCHIRGAHPNTPGKKFAPELRGKR